MSHVKACENRQSCNGNSIQPRVSTSGSTLTGEIRYDVWQGERGERSGRLMLGLYSLAGLQAVHTVQARLRDGENVFAYLVCVF